MLKQKIHSLLPHLSSSLNMPFMCFVKCPVLTFRATVGMALTIAQVLQIMLRVADMEHNIFQQSLLIFLQSLNNNQCRPRNLTVINVARFWCEHSGKMQD